MSFFDKSAKPFQPTTFNNEGSKSPVASSDLVDIQDQLAATVARMTEQEIKTDTLNTPVRTVRDVLAVMRRFASGGGGGSGSSGGTISDGTYGDIQVSSSGSIWTILSSVISTFGRTLTAAASAAAARTILELGTLATQNGTFSGTSSGTNTGDQNLFSTIAVSGQSNVVADSASDTLTLAAGTGITLTTDAGSDTVTVTNSGPMQRVERQVVAGSAVTTVTFSSLDLDTHGQYVLLAKIKNATGSTATISLLYNGDTTATNYNGQTLQVTATSVIGNRGNNAALFAIAANSYASGKIEMFAPADADVTRARSSFNYSPSASVGLQDTNHTWTNAGNVTSLTISSNVANSIAIGSVFELYRITY